MKTDSELPLSMRRIAIYMKVREIEQYTRNEDWHLLQESAQELVTLAELINNFCPDPANTSATGEKPKENTCTSHS